MSSIARWTYTNTATVKPFNGMDMWGNESYGTEYEIACTWTAVDSDERMMGGQSGAGGSELILKHEVYTEDARPKYMDMILLNGATEWEKIRERTGWDMSPFADTPDFKLVTG